MDLQNMTLNDILEKNPTLKKKLEDLALGKNLDTVGRGEVNPTTSCVIYEEKLDHHNLQPSTYSNSSITGFSGSFCF